METKQFEAILDAWIECVLWAERVSEDTEDYYGASVERHEKELSKASEKALRARARRDLRNLIQGNETLVDAFIAKHGEEQFGHSAYLSCAGHGAGFFDFGANDLQAAARSCPAEYCFWTTPKYRCIQFEG